jgi:hypothetical protein
MHLYNVGKSVFLFNLDIPEIRQMALVEILKMLL